MRKRWSKMKLKHKPIRIDKVSQPYKSSSHKGIDLVDKRGAKAPVYATANGTVVACSKGAWDWSYGNMVAIHHGNKEYTNHAHLSKIKVKLGQKVKAGDVIGYQGSTGRSTGNHLHFEIHLGKWNRVNPKPYIDAIGKSTSKATSSKPKYTKGKTYTLQYDMNVRKGASTSYAKVPVSKWTKNAREHATKDGLLKKGTKVTCIDTKNGWIKIPSGWVCGYSGSKVYVK